MKNIIKKSRSIIVQFLKFGIVGFSNTIISYLIYSFLVFLNVNYLIASIISFVVSVLNSFYWNNKFVFKKNNEENRSIFSTLIKTFTAYSITGLFLNNILLVILIEKLIINKYLAPLLVLIVTIPLNFILNKYWAFNSYKRLENEKD